MKVLCVRYTDGGSDRFFNVRRAYAKTWCGENQPYALVVEFADGAPDTIFPWINVRSYQIVEEVER